MMTSATKHLAYEGEVVELAIDLPTPGLKAGTRGVVVEAYTEPTEAYDVEFEDENGEFVDIATVRPEQIANISREALERGFELLEGGRLAAAERQFRRAVGYNPRYLEELNHFIAQIAELGEWRRAIPLFRLVLRIEPQFQLARDNLSIAFEHYAIAQARAGNMPNALELFFAALDVRPAAEVAERVRQDLSAAHTHMGKSAYEAAVEDESHGKLVSAKEGLGQSLFHMRIAHAFWPNDTTVSNVSLAFAHLALYYLDRKELEPSLDMFEMMDQTGVIRPEFLNEYGVALGMSGRLEEAVNVLERALELLPEDATIQANLRNATENIGVPFEMIHPTANLIPFLPSEFPSPYAAA
jgi:tetratricopeptide (TPR) repeat protein